MANFSLSYLLSRLDDLEGHLDERPKDFVEADIDGLTQEVLHDVTKSIDLANLNTRLEASAAIDIDSMRLARATLEAADLGGPLEIAKDRFIDPKETLSQLKETVEELATTHTKKSELGLAWVLEFHLAAIFSQALLLAANAHADLSKLSDLVTKKIGLLTDSQVASVWSSLRREFDDDRRGRMQDLESLLPPNFLQFETSEKARKKIVKYVIHLKPSLTLAMMRQEIAWIPKKKKWWSCHESLVGNRQTLHAQFPSKRKFWAERSVDFAPYSRVGTLSPTARSGCFSGYQKKAEL
jgi:hypothetical protein